MKFRCKYYKYKSWVNNGWSPHRWFVRYLLYPKQEINGVKKRAFQIGVLGFQIGVLWKCIR